MKFLYKETTGLLEKNIFLAADSLREYLDLLQQTANTNDYKIYESSLALPSDAKNIAEVLKKSEELRSPNLRYFVDIGIGGSNLGTKAIYDALFGFFDVIEPARMPKMLFADTSNPTHLQKLSTFLKNNIKHKDEVVVNIISKSGSTTETIANAEVVLAALSGVDGVASRVVLTTDMGSQLDAYATKKGYSALHLPKLVGGRYSVFSAVGLFPLATIGVDIKKLTHGAVAARVMSLDTNVNSNPAILSASILYLLGKTGKTINDNFFFHGELESLGKWYRQLMGESIGKVGRGLTPTVSIGSTDLHSVAQLYYGGPKDKVTTFVRAVQVKADINVPQEMVFEGLVSHISGQPVSHIMRAIEQGVAISYKNEALPYTEVILDDISEYSIGEFMQFKMIEMMFLGKLLDVNAFDQPHVELYKTEMKKILAQ